MARVRERIHMSPEEGAESQEPPESIEGEKEESSQERRDQLIAKQAAEKAAWNEKDKEAEAARLAALAKEEAEVTQLKDRIEELLRRRTSPED